MNFLKKLGNESLGKPSKRWLFIFHTGMYLDHLDVENIEDILNEGDHIVTDWKSFLQNEEESHVKIFVEPMIV